ncbi:hypothetical protein DMC47_20410 [Nostoc sp. 3335mG]|nr:hypothetical protein DMC47_20410 [Nostoc sp. 3335mG]
MFYPLLLIVLRRKLPGHVGTGILVMILLSFALSLYLSIRSPTSAFYLLPTRAWELGIGALVALGMVPKLSSAIARNIAALAGLALVVFAIFQIRETDLFPAPWALLPCLGAMLMIAYGRNAVTAPLMTVAPMRWVGAISYSLYLWHWPIITFYRLRYGMEFSDKATILLVALSFVAASLSYVLVEQPFLRRYRNAPSKRVLPIGIASLAAVIVAALVTGAQSIAVTGHPDDVRRVAKYADYRALPQYQYQFRRGTCFIGEGQTFDAPNCLQVDPRRANVIVLGDSHAAQYWRALALRFPQVNVMQATVSGCRPTVRAIGRERCLSIVRQALEVALHRPGITGVVLGGQWRSSEVPKLVDTVKLLQSKGLAVTVIGPTVEYDGDMPQLLARAMLRGDPTSIEPLRRKAREKLDATMRPAIEAAGARYYSEVAVECPNGKCSLFDSEGGPYHFDYGHLTLAAARQVVVGLDPIDRN